MTIFLYGSDAERRSKKLKWITSEYEQKHSAFSVQVFDFSEDGTFGRFKDSLTAGSLFASHRLLVVRDIFPAPQDMEKEYAEVLRGVLEKKELIVLIVSTTSPTKAFAFLLEKPAIAHEFSLTKENRGQNEFFADVRSAKGARSCAEALPFALKLLTNEDPAYVFNMFAAFAFGEEKKIGPSTSSGQAWPAARNFFCSFHCVL